MPEIMEKNEQELQLKAIQTLNMLEANNVGGSILVRNNGGYVARFSVKFNLNGQVITKDSGDFTLGVNKSIDIPAEATEIHLKVEEAWFIKSWSTIFTKDFGTPVNKSYEISGTTLNPKWKEI
ncbi:Thiol-activated cytolysin [Hathewaya proteolytica DSM 3090]|uniref:Thiol-activated cytolysin n=1 Tax=Hathewaya proteolytica DSM 3090 TaxID=1121331 RepID=A0A1M6ND71_9CLOT|nr:thiol-activated cytolysin C-terminal domain-containing protein [Hathewaya proteolytica]SHJ93708.1 Thiol-activated cytolysin [Hathewaya proteolytica DSM 3090]